jgi:hypothetical protein
MRKQGWRLLHCLPPWGYPAAELHLEPAPRHLQRLLELLAF